MIFSPRRSVIYIASVWFFVALVVIFPMLFLWSTIGFGPKAATCVMMNTMEVQVGYTAFIVAFFVVLCLSTICICYFCVSRFIQQHNLNTISMSAQEINWTETLFVLVFTITALWIPTFLTIVLCKLVPKTQFPCPFVLMITFLIHLSSALNPWIYGFLCPVVRNKIKSTLLARRPRK